MWSRQISSCSHTAVHIWHTGMWFCMKINCVGTKCTVVKLKMNSFLETIFLHSRASAWAWSFSLGLLQKAQLSPEGLWVKEGACPHLQLALCCSLQIRIRTPFLTATVRQPSQGSYSGPRVKKEARSFLGIVSISVNYVSSRGLFSRESPSVGSC